MTNDYHVIIVGAGIVGTALAAALAAEKSLRICLVESQVAMSMTADDSAELRVSAINPTSQQFLSNIGIWQHLFTERLSPFREMLVWEQANQLLHFDSAEIGQPHLGHILENRHIQQAGLQYCQCAENIDLICPDEVVSIDQRQLCLTSGRTICAQLIIAADGAGSPLRKAMMIPFQGWDYQQQGIVCTVSTEKPHRQIARQRFLPGGPLAFLPLNDPHQSSIVWSNPTTEAERIKKLSDQVFQRLLAHNFEQQLGEVSVISQRLSFPLSLRHAKHYVKEGFALVGDSAHTVHPLAGQGANIGLLDAATLAEVVIQAKQTNRDIGNLQTLRKYQRRRKADNLLIQIALDGLKHLFSNHHPSLAKLRQFGLFQVDQQQWLKNYFMQQAIGKRSYVPLMCQEKP